MNVAFTRPWKRFAALAFDFQAALNATKDMDLRRAIARDAIALLRLLVCSHVEWVGLMLKRLVDGGLTDPATLREAALRAIRHGRGEIGVLGCFDASLARLAASPRRVGTRTCVAFADHSAVKAACAAVD